MKKLPLLLSISLTAGACLFQVDATYAKPKPKPDPKPGKKVEQPHKGPQKPGPGPQKGHPAPPPHRDREREKLREDARAIIQRTTVVLREAQQTAKRHRYTRGLAKAVAHQERARELYWRGDYKDAIFHSLRARDLAFQIIRGNRQSYRKEYDWNDMERRYRHDCPKDDDLDVRIEWRSRNDKEMLTIKLIFDLD